ncbi:uncharacterized protein N7479_009811 [Penicillium vulpinum]|uniref:Uncharacterized protein n=1 Tax=Penicillium vulpinum TaxID=29845 RepID=A0A1V6RYM8_9EURO|nr:uncharacterized protein N7479_009811 [Penicillium vulpinum]KAJ5951398.1 hypothetical protein N7479_009811 [Penicillium vulpinum]OQE06716.1 hypothetical protein PENVUL_c017G03671 [Penicillium vulpinum]
MPYYQASVFQSSQLEHGRRFHFKEPHTSQGGWIWGSVTLPDTMDIHSDDREIIIHICNTIAAGLVTWGDRSLHGLGFNSVSFPIRIETPEQDLDELMFQVEYIALWWVPWIQSGTVTIDKHMLFVAKQPSSEREDQLLDIPLNWDQPEEMIADPWCAVTELR